MSDKAALALQIIFWIVLGYTLFVVLPIIAYSRKKKRSIAEYEAKLTQRMQDEGFRTEKEFALGSGLLRFDYHNRLGLYLPYTNPTRYYLTPLTEMKIFPLNKVAECALVQDGTMVHHNAVLPGMVGAAAFGLAGALAGATATNRSENVGHLSVRVFIDDLHISSLTITILNESTRKSDQLYLNRFNLAQEVYNEFEGIIRVNQRPTAAAPAAAPAATAASPAAHPAAQPAAAAPAAQTATGKALTDNALILEQIRHLAQMHKDGILTDAEFDEKKKLYMSKIV